MTGKGRMIVLPPLFVHECTSTIPSDIWEVNGSYRSPSVNLTTHYSSSSSLRWRCPFTPPGLSCFAFNSYSSRCIEIIVVWIETNSNLILIIVKLFFNFSFHPLLAAPLLKFNFVKNNQVVRCNCEFTMCKKYFSALFEWRYLATITTKRAFVNLSLFHKQFSPLGKWKIHGILFLITFESKGNHHVRK